MGVVEARAFVDTQDAFDSVAPHYDRLNAENWILCEMRRRTRAAFRSNVSPGARVVDLGCGPGCDAEYLARRGYVVTAIDWSPAMVDQARERVRDAGLDDRVDVRHLAIHQLDRLAPAVFDAAYSSFGPLNCVSDLAAAARIIASRIRPGGVLVASVIGRVCPWEIGLYLWRRDWARVRVRFAKGLIAVPLNGRTVWTRYYTPRQFEQAFAAAGFSRISLRTLGLFVPPPYLESFAERRPRLVTRLQIFEDAVAGYPLLRAWGDHFLTVLRRA